MAITDETLLALENRCETLWDRVIRICDEWLQSDGSPSDATKMRLTVQNTLCTRSIKTSPKSQ
jgi:hypothetical protein